jgi:hypothetical protein
MTDGYVWLGWETFDQQICQGWNTLSIDLAILFNEDCLKGML